MPLIFAGFEHVPVVGEQVPAMWHWSEAVHATGLLPVHTPLWQVSVCVQALPSLQVLPLAFAGFEHVPVAGSHVPAERDWSEAVPATGLLPVQTPLWQVSVFFYNDPSTTEISSLSLHVALPILVGEQVPAVWHWSEAVHATGLLPVHTPLWQASVCVQALLSL